IFATCLINGDVLLFDDFTPPLFFTFYERGEILLIEIGGRKRQSRNLFLGIRVVSYFTQSINNLLLYVGRNIAGCEETKPRSRHYTLRPGSLIDRRQFRDLRNTFLAGHSQCP